MVMPPERPPSYQDAGFTCPHCQAFAEQVWCATLLQDPVHGQFQEDRLYLCRCRHCENPSLWWQREMVYPDTATAPMPNADLSDDIKHDYLEARSIMARSPRGAAALLRLCIQKLCIELEESSNVNVAIGSLLKKGLDPRIQQSLDIVRVVGNNAVHPGQIELADNAEIAMQLFRLVNLIADVLITQPGQVAALYSELPSGARDAIEQRDQPST
jgi:hypothetical protein